MDWLEHLSNPLVVVGLMALIGYFVFRFAMHQTGKAIDAERSARDQILAELRQDKNDQAKEIATLKVEYKLSQDESKRNAEAVVRANRRVDELERNLNIVLTQLEEVHQQLNRREEENARQLETISVQEQRIAQLETHAQTLRIQRDEARLALTLVQGRAIESAAARPTTDEITTAAEKLQTELERDVKEPTDPNVENEQPTQEG